MPSPQDSLAVLNSGHTAKSGYGVLIHGAGAPTDGTSGTLGAILYWDETNKVLYQNTNTVASPTWQKVARNGQAFTSALTPTGGIAAAGGFTFSPRTCHTGGVPAQISTEGTDLAVVVTELYVAEVFIPANCTVTGAAVMWGSATNGNAKVMLFNSSGTRVAISASTDVSGYTADSYGSLIAFSSTYAAVGPATYYLGVICDDNTNKVNTHILGAFGAGKITGLVYATESGYASITVPTTFTTGLGPIATLY